MASLFKLTTTFIMTLYLPLISILIVIIITRQTAARELRPSDHGLEYQSITPPEESPEMRSFFKGSVSNSSTMALPKATNSTDTAWWRSVGSGGGGGRGGRDHVRHVLLVASLVCGGTGVALFVASGLVYVFRYKKHRSSSTPPCTTNNNSNTK